MNAVRSLAKIALGMGLLGLMLGGCATSPPAQYYTLAPGMTRICELICESGNAGRIATGVVIDITAIGEQFGLMFWHEERSNSHNLRTVVVDSCGRVQKILPENEWTSDELVAEMPEAAKKAP